MRRARPSVIGEVGLGSTIGGRPRRNDPERCSHLQPLVREAPTRGTRTQLRSPHTQAAFGRLTRMTTRRTTVACDECGVLGGPRFEPLRVRIPHPTRDRAQTLDTLP